MKLNNDDIQYIKKLYEEDRMSSTKIGELYSTTSATVIKKLRSIGVEIRKRNSTDVLMDEKTLLNIKKLYEEGSSADKIAVLYNTTQTVMFHRLHSMGINMREAKFKSTISITDDEAQHIKKLYVEDRLPACKIAKLLHRDIHTILKLIKSTGIVLRKYKVTPKLLDQDILQHIKKLYEEDMLPACKIAEIYNVFPSTITRKLKSMNIHIRHKNNIIYNKRAISLTSDIVNDYKLGIPIVEICEKYNIVEKVLVSRLKELKGIIIKG